MFDLSNLNDYEFEILCKDIMQELLKTKLYTFSRGIDSGVDICDKERKPTIIIQAKHYIGSSYSQLKASLKKELPKVKKHRPRSYYVCTSQSLTRKNKLEISEIFDEFMTDISHVIDKNDINSFLEEEQNKDIVEKNYKLWLCATDILSLVNNQNVFIDCTELMLDIEEQIKLFVETQAYQEAVEKLSQENVLIIIGAPGVGKSTISKMLLLYYANKDYKVRYVTNNNIADIKRTLNRSPNKKEILLLDDFLGQHYLQIKDSQPNELKTLISFISRNRQKKIILNSRVTILNEATQSSLIFNDIMHRYKQNKYLLDLDRMSAVEKAKILYNHLYFNNLPQEYLSQIKHNTGYLKIVNHKNYNPRIIEFVARNYKTVSASNYLQYIIGKLNNPQDVWKDEFRNRLEMYDRILMNTLYSLSDTAIDNSVLENAFNERIISESTSDTSINQYQETLIRLTDSLIKIIDDKSAIKIAAINPSINDYLFSEISSNVNEQIAIIENAVYYEQIFKALKSNSANCFYKKKLLSQDLLKMNTLNNTSYFYFLKSIIELNIKNLSLKRKVNLSLEQAYSNLSNQSKEEYGEIIKELYSEEYCEFYKLQNTFLSSKKMLNILKPLILEDAIVLINSIMDDYDLTEGEELLETYKSCLSEKITEHVQDVLSDELSDAVSVVLRKADSVDIGEFMEGTSSFLEDLVWDELEDSAYDKVKEYLALINTEIDMDTDDIDISDMRYYISISDGLSFALKGEYEDDDLRRYNSSGSDTALITAIFER